MFFDAHVHIFPETKIPKDLRNKITSSVALLPNSWKKFRQIAQKKAIFKAIAFPLPTSLNSVASGNNFLLTAFHRNQDTILPSLLAGAGPLFVQKHIKIIAGLKEHFSVSSETGFMPDEEYALLQDNNLCLTIHPHRDTIVQRVNFLCTNFPRLTIILAHAGRKVPGEGEGVLQVAKEVARFDNLLFDTSTIRDSGTIKNLIDKVGAERVLFGSDYPFQLTSGEDVYQNELEAIHGCGLTDHQLELVLRLNFQRTFLPDQIIRRVSHNDQGQLFELLEGIPEEERRFLALGKKSALIKSQIKNERHVFVVESNSKIIGFLRECGRPDDGALIEEVYIAPAHRSSRLGLKLLAVVRDRFSWAEAKTLSTNQKAVRLFHAAGFKQVAAPDKSRILKWIWNG